MSDQPKTKEERVREGITILTKLRGVGIIDAEPGFQEIQNLIRTWVSEGETIQARVEFPRYGRVAEILLPRRARNSATCVLKMVASSN